MMTSDRPEHDLEISIMIARPPEEIWSYLVDVSNEAQWRDDVTDAKWISDAPHGVGSTGLHIVESVGNLPWIISGWEEPRIMSWEVTGGRLDGWQNGYRLAAEDDRSRMTIHIGAKSGLLMRILMPILKPRLKHQYAAYLENLKAIMEA